MKWPNISLILSRKLWVRDSLRAYTAPLELATTQNSFLYSHKAPNQWRRPSSHPGEHESFKTECNTRAHLHVIREVIKWAACHRGCSLSAWKRNWQCWDRLSWEEESINSQSIHLSGSPASEELRRNQAHRVSEDVGGFSTVLARAQNRGHVENRRSTRWWCGWRNGCCGERMVEYRWG